MPATSSEQRPEIVAVADMSRLLSSPVPDVRVPLHEDSSLRSHRHAQSGSQLQRRRSHFRPPHALREAGVAQQRDVRFPSPVSQVLRRVYADFRQRFSSEDVAAYQAHSSVSKYRNSWFAETPSQEITPNPGNPMKNNTLPIKNVPRGERLPRPVRIKEKQPGMHLSSLLPALQVAKMLQANFLSFSHGHFWFLQFIRLR